MGGRLGQQEQGQGPRGCPARRGRAEPLPRSRAAPAQPSHPRPRSRRHRPERREGAAALTAPAPAPAPRAARAPAPPAPASPASSSAACGPGRRRRAPPPAPRAAACPRGPALHQTHGREGRHTARLGTTHAASQERRRAATVLRAPHLHTPASPQLPGGGHKRGGASHPHSPGSSGWRPKARATDPLLTSSCAGPGRKRARQ